MSDKLMQTPLNKLHQNNHARMTAFAGYNMPLQYENGIMSEHLHTRSHAGLFDVSHMGQIVLRGNDFNQVAEALETLIPMEVKTLKAIAKDMDFLQIIPAEYLMILCFLIEVTTFTWSLTLLGKKTILNTYVNI